MTDLRKLLETEADEDGFNVQSEKIVPRARDPLSNHRKDSNGERWEFFLGRNGRWSVFDLQYTGNDSFKISPSEKDRVSFTEYLEVASGEYDRGMSEEFIENVFEGIEEYEIDQAPSGYLSEDPDSIYHVQRSGT